MITDKALPITNGFNFRELGGYQTRSGQTVRTHKLIRSGALNALSPAELTYLSDYGLRYVVDFRSLDESTPRPDRIPAGATAVPLPTFRSMPGAKTSSTAAAAVKDAANDDVGLVVASFKDAPADLGFKRMLTVYEGLVTGEGARSAYRDFFQLLLKNTAPGHSVDFHCSAGKDRTGIAAFLVLSALGVDFPTIQGDYLVSADYNAAHVAARRAELVAAGAGDNVLQIVRDRMTVRPEYLAHARELIEQQWGSVEKYLADWLGVDEAATQALKQLYLA